jgi:hypothetical protein
MRKGVTIRYGNEPMVEGQGPQSGKERVRERKRGILGMERERERHTSETSVFFKKTTSSSSSSSFPVLGLLRPVMGVTKLNPSIFSKVFLNLFSESVQRLLR